MTAAYLIAQVHLLLLRSVAFFGLKTKSFSCGPQLKVSRVDWASPLILAFLITRGLRDPGMFKINCKDCETTLDSIRYIRGRDWPDSARFDEASRITVVRKNLVEGWEL